MGEWIGGYRCITPMRTVGSGSARWCIAARGLERYFLKEFLSPVWPANEETELGKRQAERCRAFEQQKQRLYASAACVIGDALVPVIDFFRFERHYYAVSEAVPDSHITAGEVKGLTPDEKRRLLFDLSLCLQRLHMQGIVHADLKPEHVLLLKRPEGYRVSLIDLDSGFLLEEPPMGDPEGDPAYLAPETFLRMVGQEALLGPEADVFAFGAMIHFIWTGRMPAFDRERYSYLYEAVLEDGDIWLDDEMPEPYRVMIRRMLNKDPKRRPVDARVTALFEEKPILEPAAESRPRNGLQRLMYSREEMR